MLGVSSIVAPAGGANSTAELTAILSKLRSRGVSMSRAFHRVAGPFPVAGPARWADDWLAPRCDPYPHRHKGVDIFAPAGTPLVAAADGRVSLKAVRSVGGLSVEITARDGVEYYYAHLSSFARRLRVGRRVWTGDVVGYVGDTGNARGTPHLHFEIQPGGAAVPPKPDVDRWLERAERRARRWVRVLAEREARRTESLGYLATRVLVMPRGYGGPELAWSPTEAGEGADGDEGRRLLLAIGRPLLLVLDRLGGPLGADGGYLRALGRSVARASAPGPALQRGVSAVVSAVVPASPLGQP